MNEWVKEEPVGAVVLCRTDRDIVAIKFGTAQTHGKNLWKTSEGTLATDFSIEQASPQRLYRDDRYDEGYEDGYNAGHLDGYFA